MMDHMWLELIAKATWLIYDALTQLGFLLTGQLLEPSEWVTDAFEQWADTWESRWDLN